MIPHHQQQWFSNVFFFSPRPLPSNGILYRHLKHKINEAEAIHIELLVSPSPPHPPSPLWTSGGSPMGVQGDLRNPEATGECGLRSLSPLTWCKGLSTPCSFMSQPYELTNPPATRHIKLSIMAHRFLHALCTTMFIPHALSTCPSAGEPFTSLTYMSARTSHNSAQLDTVLTPYTHSFLPHHDGW